MSLETYTGYIPALVDQNPTPTDPKSEGDDHLRGIKLTLSQTFIGFTEPDQGVEVTATEINQVCAGGVASAMPAGMVAPFAMQSVPNAGWLWCNGVEKLIEDFPTLYAAIGTLYGGDGITTFALPDMRGLFARGYPGGGPVDPGRVFGSTQAASNAAHTHTIDIAAHTHTESPSGDHTHVVNGVAEVGSSVSETGSGRNEPVNTSIETTAEGNHIHEIFGGNHTHNAQSEGGEARPVNISLYYCIKT